MEQWFPLLEKYKRVLLRKPNVIGVGLGYKEKRGYRTEEPAIVVLVEKKLPSQQLSRRELIPRKMGELETDVIAVGRIRLLNSRTVQLRPAQPGVSIGHYLVSAGTLGAVVRDRRTKEKLILSNNHVLANTTNGRDGRASIGDPIYQPGVYDGGNEAAKIGTLLRFVPIERSQSEVDCLTGKGLLWITNTFLKALRSHYRVAILAERRQGNLVDAAVARPDDPAMVSEEILEIGKVTGVAAVELGQKVWKSGRTSGVTSGKVTAVAVTVQVEVGSNEQAWFTDQVVSDLPSRPGDSGSLVVDEQHRAVGLLFAGSDKYTVFTPIQKVLDALQVEI